MRDGQNRASRELQLAVRQHDTLRSLSQTEQRPHNKVLRISVLALESRFEIRPVVVGPVVRRQRKMCFFAVHEEFEEDLRGSLGAVKDKLEVRAHGHPVCLAPDGNVVGVVHIVAETIHVQIHQQGQ